MECFKRNLIKLILTAAALAAVACGSALAEQDVEIGPDTFPDENFREVVAEFDTNHDGVLSVSELAKVTLIDCYYRNISDMKGIEYFTALKTLDCSSNHLTGLDVSRNTALIDLHCDSNGLNSLDISRNTALKSLECQYNDLQDLDISKNKKLTALICRCNELEALNTNANTALEKLDCSDNRLTELDIRNNKELKELDCSDNMLTALDVSSNMKIHDLSCDSNQLTRLNIIHLPDILDAVDYGAKEELYPGVCRYSGSSGRLTVDDTVQVITGTAITETLFPDGTFRSYVESYIDTNGDGMLSINECSTVTSICVNVEVEGENRYGGISSLKGIEIFTALENLDCSHCRLTALNLSANTALKELNCRYNNLAALDLNTNTALERLNCSSNKLTVLDLSANTALITLNCNSNKLTKLDVRNNIVTNLDCSFNELTSLEVGDNYILSYFSCSFNRLKTLDISGLRRIVYTLYNGTVQSYPDSGYYYYISDNDIYGGTFYVDMNTDLIVKPLPEDCLRIPDSVTTIDAEAFRGIAATSVFIPGSVTSIDPRAFSSGTTIYGAIGYVQYWARENGFYFVPVVK